MYAFLSTISTITENIAVINVATLAALATVFVAYLSLIQNERTQKSILLWELMKEESRLSCQIREASGDKRKYQETYLNFFDGLGTLYISGGVSKKDIKVYFKEMIIDTFESYRKDIYNIRKKYKNNDSYKNFEILYQEIMESKKDTSKTRNIINKVIEVIESHTPYIAFVLGIPYGLIFLLQATSTNNTSLIDTIKTFNIIVTSFIILSATLAILSFTYFNNIDKNDKTSRTIFRIAETEFYATILYGIFLIAGTIVITTNQSNYKIITDSLSLISLFTVMLGSGLLTLGIVTSIIVMFRRLTHRRTTQNTV